MLCIPHLQQADSDTRDVLSGLRTFNVHSDYLGRYSTIKTGGWKFLAIGAWAHSNHDATSLLACRQQTSFRDLIALDHIKLLIVYNLQPWKATKYKYVCDTNSAV